jgi:hypothetical protein
MQLRLIATRRTVGLQGCRASQENLRMDSPSSDSLLYVGYVNVFTEHPGGCYTCRWFGERLVGTSVWCGYPSAGHVRSQAGHGCAFWQRELGSDDDLTRPGPIARRVRDPVGYFKDRLAVRSLAGDGGEVRLAALRRVPIHARLTLARRKPGLPLYSSICAQA